VVVADRLVDHLQRGKNREGSLRIDRRRSRRDGPGRTLGISVGASRVGPKEVLETTTKGFDRSWSRFSRSLGV
jgi:hypothetical protein